MIQDLRFKIGLGLFFLFLFLSLGVFLGFLRYIDWQALNFLQTIIPGQMDGFLSLFSLVGKFETASLILFIILIFLNKKSRFVVLSGYVVLIFIGVLGKVLIEIPGPPIEFLRTQFFLPFLPSGILTEGLFAYPSGHVSRSVFISLILWLAFYKKVKSNKSLFLTLSFSLLIFNLFMLISRVYLAEHWLSDVLAERFWFILACLTLSFEKLNILSRLDNSEERRA